MNPFISLPALGAVLGTAFLLTGCAAPPLKYYSFNEGNEAMASNRIITYTTATPIILIQPVTVPDYLDTTDIVTRDKNTIHHRVNGRMSSVLSVAITGFVTDMLANQHPNLLITNQHTVEPPTTQLVLNITQLDVQEAENQTGVAILKANWAIIPKDPNQPIQKQNGTFTSKGSIATDADIIQLEQGLLTQMIQQISRNRLD